MYEQAKSKLIEKEVLEAIRQLQENKNKAFAFTARRTGKPKIISKESVEDVTIKLLAELGIYFSSSFSEHMHCSLQGILETPIPIEDHTLIPFEEPGPPLLKSGALFSAGFEKDAVLQALFKLIGEPEEFMIIDDKYENLVRIKALCARLGIKCIAYHYRASVLNDNKINPEVADLQFQTVLEERKWLSDEEAKAVLEEVSADVIDDAFEAEYEDMAKEAVVILDSCEDTGCTTSRNFSL